MMTIKESILLGLPSVHLKTSLGVPDMIQSGITAGFAFQIADWGDY